MKINKPVSLQLPHSRGQGPHPLIPSARSSARQVSVDSTFPELALHCSHGFPSAASRILVLQVHRLSSRPIMEAVLVHLILMTTCEVGTVLGILSSFKTETLKLSKVKQLESEP